MSPVATVMPTGAQTRNGENGEKAVAVVANPFVRAAREHVEPFDDWSQILQTAVSVVRGPVDVAAFGYLRHIILLVAATGGVGGAATVAAKEDAPWSALRDIQVTDVNGVPIFGPVNGYDLYQIDKLGGYTYDTDPANSPAYSAVATGAGATGNFSFLARIPVEIAQRDALGALPNMNAASTYKGTWTLGPATDIYSTAPATTLPTVRVRAFIEAWSQPLGSDLRGMPNMTQPPAIGTTQYWSKQFYNVQAGDQRIRLTRVGNMLRNLIFILRNTSDGLRSTTNFPDPVRFEWDSKIVFNEARDIWRNYVREHNGFAPDTGVFPLQFTYDLDYKPGDEMRDLYLPTTQATRLELVGTFGAAGTLTVLTNDVAPSGDIFVE